MNEYYIGFLAAGNVFILSIACALYMMGGRNNKGIRRYGASFIIALSLNVTAAFMGKWWWPLLLVYPLKFTEFCLGYAGDFVWQRIIKRTLIVLLSALIGILVMFSMGGGIWLFLIQIVAGLITVIFAWKNPIAAAAEEPLVCFLNNGVLLFYPFIM